MNLIICCTPLQVLIAIKIMELYPNEKFYGLMIAPVKNKKYLHYFNKLTERCQESFFILRVNYSKCRYFITFFIISFLLKSLERKNSIEKIFIANISDGIIQYVCSRLKVVDLYTFDDGTVNIVENGFNSTTKESKLKTITRFVLNFTENIDTIKGRSKLHYTIYPGLPNIITNTREINLFSTIKYCNYVSDTSEVKIMLGQPIFSNDDENKKLIESIIDQYEIDFYFPHPRETFLVENIDYIKTNLIFEDYFANYLVNSKCIIYTFFSSAALSVSHLANVKVISFRIKELPEYTSNIYSVVKYFNLSIIEI